MPTPEYVDPATLMSPDTYASYLAWKSQQGSFASPFIFLGTDGKWYMIDASGNITPYNP